MMTSTHELTKLNAMRSLEPAAVIGLDYSKYMNSTADLDRNGRLRGMSDEELIVLIRDRVTRRFKHSRLAFNYMVRGASAMNKTAQHQQPRITLDGLHSCLNAWDIPICEARLRKIIAIYEPQPDVGLDYTAFAGILSQESTTDLKERRELNASLEGSGGGGGKPVSRSTASAVLQRTTASIPSGRFADYDRTIKVCLEKFFVIKILNEPKKMKKYFLKNPNNYSQLYGCGNGLDINSDGTNNGFFVSD